MKKAIASSVTYGNSTTAQNFSVVGVSIDWSVFVINEGSRGLAGVYMYLFSSYSREVIILMVI
ncbi:hypothetical protein MA03_05000 [Infirmifilum uzonense]|uniref:Uncharacterized protein n=1 Tax=Infirmifilum uzonense TaxID=1550241 RepID=A0A0F7FIT8_9CREN|nr:hypothetical protein [Infirmifilum uzonense]AKG38757.1 hypothetical protein MA03_05000 [Infirmifilum uzonense]